MKNKHYYRDMSPDEIENIFSHFLFDSWSFSKVSSFARNEKAFEMQYIYNRETKRSTSSIAGEAYHKALDYYFSGKKDGDKHDIVLLQEEAYNYISNVDANKWKIQKTLPTIEECIIKATKDVTTLLNNFFTDISVYEEDLKEVLYSELYVDEFLTINGVDVPLPCHGRIDLVIETKSNKTVLIDHKSKSSYTDDKDAKFSIGKQAIVYAKAFEEKTGLVIDEVWFIENKKGKNRDGSPQIISFKIELNKDNRTLYEAILYEPLKRMLEAISDPDYVYIINENDNFIDKAEIYEFWATTMMAEVEDFDIPDNKKELVEKRLKKIRDVSIASIDPRTIKKFRENAAEFIKYDLTNKNMTKTQKIEHTLRTLGKIVSIPYTFSGYSSETFLIEMTSGVKLSDIFKYQLDIANALNVSNVRIQKDLFVYNGSSYLAVESGKTREMDLNFDPKYLDGLKIPIGLDNFNEKVVWDMENPSTPHVLIGGSTGSGKSVCLISIIEYAKLAGINNIIIFDPKYEFTAYKSKGIEVYSDIEDIEAMMELMVEKMNDLVKSGRSETTLILFDEFADAVANSRKGAKLDVYKDEVVGVYKTGIPKTKRVKVDTKNSLEENLRILLQKGRSSGFRIIAATQRASVKVITGDAKVNFPVQICFKVPKEIDSKVIIDEPGAESLTGKGDGLFKSPEYQNKVIRFQSFYKN